MNMNFCASKTRNGGAEFGERNRVISGKRVYGIASKTNIFLINSREEKSLGVRGLISQSRAICRSYAVTVGVLKCGAIGPSHDEVTMIPEASWITLSQHKPVEITVVPSFEVKFVKDRENCHGVGLRAHSTVVVSDSWVSDMTFVVRSVDVDSIPAGGEVNFGAELAALHRGEPVGLS